MSDFEEHFKTTDYTNFVPNENQKQSLQKNFNFVKGSDLYKGVYDNIDANISNVSVRYYQIAMFNENDNRNIRSFLLNGQSGNGACFYNYKIAEIKNYSIHENKLDKFVNAIKNIKHNKNNNHKIIFKYYPVYNFDYTSPPSGAEISQCYSELLS